MRALLDGDILLYEIGFSSQQVVDGEVVPNSWEFCADLLDGRIAFINDEVEATEPPLLFLTNTRRINKILNKQRKREEAAPKEYVENFRVAAAEEKDYKGGRKAEKPYHFYNLLAYMLSKYDVHVDENGLEADDALCIHQINNAKECGVGVPFHKGEFMLDYEDWVKYAGVTFIQDNKGYLISDTGKGPTRKVWSLHRDIMGNPEGMVVDHINGNTLDNRRYNLRVCSVTENVRNSAPQAGTSRFKGVHWDKEKNKWYAGIKFERKQVFLGRFSSEEEAALAYDNAAKSFFGAYARLNLEAPYTKPLKKTIICSRDKDLRQCPLLHYSWEVGKQASVGPIFVHPMGWLEHKNPGERDAKGKLKPAKIFGTGHKFFYYQMLVGDAVDNIGGIKGKGPVFGYELIKDITTEREGYELVAEKYVQAWGDLWKEKMKEQALLLWMVREIDENGDKVFWRPPRRLTEEASGSRQHD